ncbi:endonuclease domain-containing protein [Plantactinospora sp. WMMB782]|uniref:endonuclease domain-containing protein n=1 Tax=Plantactinospora sp. WMMB782 TaxID=3404121 RepID=UPI003B946862
MGGIEVNGDRVRAERLKQRRDNLAARYSITIEQYAALLAHQGYVCAFCQGAKGRNGKALHVDHDHACCPYPEGRGSLRSCGRCVRGLLCSRCNLFGALDGAPTVDWDAVMTVPHIDWDAVAAILVGGAESATPTGDFLTLRQAIDAGVVPWKLDAAKKRLQRRVGRAPTPRGKSGNADLYARADLVAWVGTE